MKAITASERQRERERLSERASGSQARARERQRERTSKARNMSSPVSGCTDFRDDVGIARGMACGAIHHRLLVMHWRPPTYVERKVARDNATANS